MIKPVSGTGYDMAWWPGITRGWDARCSCTWAYGPTGWYEVKARDMMCPNHGGPLDACLARMERKQN